MTERKYMDVEDLDVYRKLCQLHIEVCDLTHQWPKEENKDELCPSGWPVPAET